MKTLGLCIVALAATICSGYIPGHEYHYHIEGSILQQLDKQVPQHAGGMFKWEMVLQAKEHGAIIKFVDTKFRLENERPHDHEEDRIYLSSPWAQEQLTKPFEITCENGVVKELKVAKDDEFWSVNFKKSIAAKLVLQTDYETANILQEDGYKDDELKLDRKNYYMTGEDGIHGECQVDYEVDDSHENVVEVTKIKSFENCERSTYRYYINHDKYIQLQSVPDLYAPIQRSEVTHYKLQGNRKKFVVEKMHSEERIELSIYGPNGDAFRGDSAVVMQLTGSEDSKEALQMPDDAVTHNDLHFQFQEPFEIHDAEDLKKESHHLFHFLHQKIPLESVVGLFNRMVNLRDDDEPYTDIFQDKAMPDLFVQLAGSMSTFNYDALQQFYDDHVIKEAKDDSKELHQRRDLFVDALTYSGTSSSFMFLKHLIIENHVPSFALPHLLQQLPLTLKEFSPVLIEEFYTLCTESHVNDNPITRKMCLLAFSKFVQDQCVAKYYNVYTYFNTTEKILCDPDVAETYFQKLLEKYEGDWKDSSEFSTFVKVAGNFGTRGSMRYMMKIIHDYSLPTYYRFSAILALSSPAEYYQEEMLPLLMPIYFNTSEVTEIRIAAFFHIPLAAIQMHRLEAIAEHLQHEPDHQVAHFTMTALQQMAASDHPNLRSDSEIAKRVLRYLKRVPFGTKFDLRHSFTVTKDKFNEEWRVGSGSDFTYITGDGYVPRFIDFTTSNMMGNLIENPGSVDYVGYGLEKYVDQIISFKKQGKSVFDLLRRKTRDVNIVEKELKEINKVMKLMGTEPPAYSPENLDTWLRQTSLDPRLDPCRRSNKCYCLEGKIEERQSEPVYGDISFYAYGSLVNFIHFNDSTFQNVAKHGGDIMPVVLNYLKDIGPFTKKRFFSGKQFKFVAPSMFGVPWYIDVSETCFFYYRNNNMKLGLEPDIFAEGAKDDTPVSVNLKIDGQLVQELTRYVVGGVFYPPINMATGAGIMKNDYHSAPLKLKIAFEPATPKLVLKQTGVSSPIVRSFKFLPFTMVYNMSEIYDGDGIKYGSLLSYARKNELKEFDFESEILEGRINGSIGHLHVLESVGSVKKFLLENSPKELISYLNNNPLAIPYDIDLTDSRKDEHDVIVTMDTFGYDTPPDKTYKPNFPTVQDGNENYINSRGDRKAQTCLLKTERVSKGGVERKVISEISYTRTFDDLYHVINILYDRSTGDHHTFKLCASSSLLFPHVDTKKLYELDTEHMDPEIKLATDIRFGKNCENDKKIKIRGVKSRTEEHQNMQAVRENPKMQCGRTNRDAYFYKKCKADNDKGIHYSINCRKYWSRSLKLRHYSIDIEHENLDSAAKSYLSAMRHRHYYYLDEHRNEVEHDANKIHIEANFSAKTDHMDVKVTAPHTILEFDHVPHPRWLQARIANPLLEFTNMMTLWSRYKYPFCSIEGDHVHTFDFAEYQLPPIDCYKVLARDCSHKQLFTVLGKTITDNRFNKAVEVFFPDLNIEALVSAESDILVRINGHHIPVTEAEPHFHYQTIGDKNVLKFIVSYNGLYYKIKSDYYGVTVYYDGKAIIINLSPYYVGKQCGLCGEYNNNEREREEFLGPTKCVYHNTTSFSYSYAVPEAYCSAIPDHAC